MLHWDLEAVHLRRCLSMCTGKFCGSINGLAPFP